MPDLDRTARVAVYIDFDNVVISRYDQVHAGRRDAWRADDVRRHAGDADSVVGQKLLLAHVDVGALLDYAASYGRVAIARAYADWSLPVNASYQRQLVDRAVDLTQLFPVSGTKNGADIRLAVDAIDDLMRYDDITHVVLVAGDSDYIALAQRCKQLGRYVVGIGVTGSTSRALVSACNEFIDYAHLPGVTTPAPVEKEAGRAKKTASKKTSKPSRKNSPEDAATDLLVRAVRVGLQKSDDDWVNAGGIKSQMQRMDPAFKEKSLGFSSFRAFVESRSDQVDSKVADNGQLTVRLK